MPEPRRRLPTKPDRPVHPGVIRDDQIRREQNKGNRRPHVPSPEPPMPYWPNTDKDQPDPGSDDERGVAEVDFRL